MTHQIREDGRLGGKKALRWWEGPKDAQMEGLLKMTEAQLDEHGGPTKHLGVEVVAQILAGETVVA